MVPLLMPTGSGSGDPVRIKTDATSHADHMMHPASSSGISRGLALRKQNNSHLVPSHLPVHDSFQVLSVLTTWC
jgi:hypothetical protein